MVYRNIFELQPILETLTSSSGYDRNNNTDNNCTYWEEGDKDESWTWTEDLVDSTPMESDPEAIDYLARHDYNLEEAVFSLHCELGCGKGETHLYEQSHIILYSIALP